MLTLTRTPQLSALWLDDDAWTLALAAAPRSSPAAPAPGAGTSDPAAWQTLLTAGVAADVGKLAPGWSDLLRAHAEAPITVSVTAAHDGLAHRGEVKVGEQATSSFLRRYQTRDEDSAGLRATSIDSSAEFCCTEPHQAWPLVRRLLPPLDVLRAKPRQTPPGERRVRPIIPAPDQLERLKSPEIGALGLLPPTVRQQLDTDTFVIITATTTLYRDGEASSTVQGVRCFAVSGSALLDVGIEAGRPAVTTVTAGEVGFAVWWLVESCRGALSRLGSGGAR